jgi:hypothetical protein
MYSLLMTFIYQLICIFEELPNRTFWQTIIGKYFQIERKRESLGDQTKQLELLCRSPFNKKS